MVALAVFNWCCRTQLPAGPWCVPSDKCTLQAMQFGHMCWHVAGALEKVLGKAAQDGASSQVSQHVSFTWSSSCFAFDENMEAAVATYQQQCVEACFQNLQVILITEKGHSEWLAPSVQHRVLALQPCHGGSSTGTFFFANYELQHPYMYIHIHTYMFLQILSYLHTPNNGFV